MRISIILLLLVLPFFVVLKSDACVGRILNIGILDDAYEHVLAELVSALIDERTGTTVNIQTFKSSEEMYEAIRKHEIGILIENTDRALTMLNINGSGDRVSDYDVSRNEFRKRLNLIWLKPFGTLPHRGDGGGRYYSAVITEDVLVNFPALPRVINKLRGISAERGFEQLLHADPADVGDVVRDFLKRMKLI